MKTTTINRKNLFVAAATFLTVLMSAGQVNAIGQNPVSAPVAVKYLGTIDAQPVFLLNVDNTAAEELTITFKNKEGEVLYSQKVTDKKFSKRFQFAAADTEEINLKLLVYSNNTKQTQVYEINKTTRVVDDVVINQL
ncbi:MAG: hypothetical protein JWQ27_1740 [Ferruginibacter sp.]|nr:hypothetical protein [Ferruginibacter sp.]